MKINHVKTGAGPKMSIRDRIFFNLYYFFSFVRFLFFLLLGGVLVVIVLSKATDFFLPDFQKNLYSRFNSMMFQQMQESHLHREAIALMETKGELMEDPQDEYNYKMLLADSYQHIGDFSKAEKVLMDAWKIACQTVQQSEDDGLKALINMATAYRIFQFYQRMGDDRKQRHFYQIAKRNYQSQTSFIEEQIAHFAEEKSWFDFPIHHLQDLFEYEDLVMDYQEHPGEAIEKLTDRVDRIEKMPTYTPSYKLKCMVQLMDWLLKEKRSLEVYSLISRAQQQIEHMHLVSEYKPLGKLSEICYQVHDVETSVQLNQLYQQYLDKYYGEDDFDYLANRLLVCKNLEATGDWSQLQASLIAYCEGMRRQIALNMPSMTEEQREYFAKQFEVAYDYAFDILKKHPNRDLATLCFDNVTFKTGLLLRSNLSTKSRIAHSQDSLTRETYEKWKQCSKELVYQEAYPAMYFLSIPKLRAEKESLEKALAVSTTDFVNKNEVALCRTEEVAEHLEKHQAMLSLVDHDGDLLALLLTSNQEVVYIPIGKRKILEEKLRRPIAEVYHDDTLSQFLWGPLEKPLSSYSDLYYVPTGIFNQLSLSSLYLGNNTYLMDEKNLSLLSNPSALESPLHYVISQKDCPIALWGGIDYNEISGEKVPVTSAPVASETPNPVQSRALQSATEVRDAIRRGEKLSYLRYTYDEVMDIAEMFGAHQKKIQVMTGKQATEQSFKDRDGKNDQILHLSTHGFFDESMRQEQIMNHSGLFFAQANHYWMNDTLSVAFGEEDGILHASEIATMDLSDCGLVVLSACETGLGYSETSEGVYGLQRAFKQAGAQQILMSLWQVSDQATHLLMTEFYRRLLSGCDSDEALRESKKIVREQYVSPEYWGAFVLLH